MKWKIIFALMGCGFLISPIQAQDITSIRQQYETARQQIALQKEEIHLQNFVKMTLQHNVPGIGPQQIHYEMQFSPYQLNEEGEQHPHRLLLAEGHYNIAARRYNEEFLFDDDEKLIFVYARQPQDIDSETPHEIRIYLNQEKPFKVILKKCGPHASSQTEDLSISTPLPDELQALLQRGKKLQALFGACQSHLIP